MSRLDRSTGLIKQAVWRIVKSFTTQLVWKVRNNLITSLLDPWSLHDLSEPLCQRMIFGRLEVR